MQKYFFSALIVFIGYFVFETIFASLKTPEIIENTLKNSLNLPYIDLSEKRLNIILKVQDPNFLNHGGTDFSNNIATTITQSLVKQLYFEKFEPGFSKIKQSLIARFVLDPQISKRDQITLFLNTVYMGTYQGKKILGYRNASQTYFEKKFIELTYEQFLALTAMLAGPNKFHILKNPEANYKRVSRIKNLLSGNCNREGLLKSYLLKNCQL